MILFNLLLLTCSHLELTFYRCESLDSNILINKNQIVFAETVTVINAKYKSSCRIMLAPTDLRPIFVVGSCETVLK
jgi:hypothetical protein